MRPSRWDGTKNTFSIQAFLGIAPTLAAVVFCFCRDGGPLDDEFVGLATTLLFFLFFSPSKFAVLSASCESFAELTSLSENILRSYSLTSRYSKS